MIARLEDRAQVIDASLAHRDARMVGIALTEMFMVMKMRDGSESEAAATVTAYASSLRDQPSWAVVEACKRHVKGEGIGSKAFAPSSAEISHMVDLVLDQIRRERSKLTQIIAAAKSASPPTPKAPLSDDLQKKLDALRRDLGASVAMEKAPKRGDPETDRFAEYRTRPSAPESEPPVKGGKT